MEHKEDFEFDAHKACEAIREEIEWQIKEWERERMEEFFGY